MRRRIFIAVVNLFAVAVLADALYAGPVICESVATVDGREPSLLPKGRTFKLIWNDEFDGDAHDICEHTTPTLSSVKPDFRRGGELAALLLAARLRDRERFRGSRRRTFGPLTVVPRASTRRLAAHAAAVSEAIDLIRREGFPACAIVASSVCAIRASSKLPNENRPDCRMKTVQTAEWLLRHIP